MLTDVGVLKRATPVAWVIVALLASLSIALITRTVPCRTDHPCTVAFNIDGVTPAMVSEESLRTCGFNFSNASPKEGQLLKRQTKEGVTKVLLHKYAPGCKADRVVEVTGSFLCRGSEPITSIDSDITVAKERLGAPSVVMRNGDLGDFYIWETPSGNIRMVAWGTTIASITLTGIGRAQESR